jgi:hypothetical protein
MTKLSRSSSISVLLGVIILSVIVQGYAAQASKGAKSGGNAGSKDIVGKWSGSATENSQSDVMEVKIDFRLEGDKITGQVYSQAGELKVTAVSFANGRWAIKCVSSEGQEAQISCSIKNDKLIGDWSFGDSTGKFELARDKN